MTTRVLSSAALTAVLEGATDEVFLVLLTIDHTDLAAPIRVVNDFANLTSRGNLFVGLPFDLELPAQTPDQPGELRITVDNVDRMIVESVRVISSPATVTLEVVLASSPDTVELSYSALTLRDVGYDAYRVTGVARFEDVTIEPIAESITAFRFPGLY